MSDHKYSPENGFLVFGTKEALYANILELKHHDHKFTKFYGFGKASKLTKILVDVLISNISRTKIRIWYI